MQDKYFVSDRLTRSHVYGMVFDLIGQRNRTTAWADDENGDSLDVHVLTHGRQQHDLTDQVVDQGEDLQFLQHAVDRLAFPSVKIGLLMNFNITKLKDGIKRFVL